MNGEWELSDPFEIVEDVDRGDRPADHGEAHDGERLLTFDAGANADGLPSILKTLEETGTPATFFSSRRTGGQSVTTVRRRVLDNLAPGSIVLMHVGSHPTDRSALDADALPGLIELDLVTDRRPALGRSADTIRSR